jgi:mRNA interferase MazF
VYPIQLGEAKRGRAQAGKRLGIVVSDGPDTWSTVTVVPTSTRALAAIFRPLLVIDGRETRALVDQVRTIDVDYVLGDPVDHLRRDDMAQVEFALGRWLSLSIELDY